MIIMEMTFTKALVKKVKYHDMIITIPSHHWFVAYDKFNRIFSYSGEPEWIGGMWMLYDDSHDQTWLGDLLRNAHDPLPENSLVQITCKDILE